MRPDRALLVLVATLFHAWLPLRSSGQSLEDDWWQPNGTVHAVARDSVNGIVYVGGDFDHVGPNIHHSALLDTLSGLAGTVRIQPNGDVRSCFPDGSGGWFIGGGFTKVDGQQRSYLARIDASGQLHPWAPTVNGLIHCVSVQGQTLYVGGAFTQINGIARNNVAAFDISSGELTGWAPGTNSTVLAIAWSGNTVFLGGSFTSAGGQPRNRVAAIDATTGLPTSWNANASGPVHALVVHADLLIAGGTFTTIGGVTRNRLASLDLSTGFATTWNPNAGGAVNTLRMQGSTLFVGGAFTGIGGSTRWRVAAFDMGTNTLLPFSTTIAQDVTDEVFTLEVVGSQVFIGGRFTRVGGQLRNHVAALDRNTGALTSWDPNASDRVLAIMWGNDELFVAGAYTSINGVKRNNTVALDETTGQPTAWAPNINGIVRCMVFHQSHVYVGGDFDLVFGEERPHIAQLDASTGSATSWNPDANAPVWALHLKEPVIYAGGDFTTIGGQPRQRVAAIVLNTAFPSPWQVASVNDRVQAITTANDAIFIGGRFTVVNSSNSGRYVAAVDANGTLLAGWNANITAATGHQILALESTNNTLYVGGIFSTVGSLSRNNIASLAISTGAVLPWNPNANGSVSMIERHAGNVLVGGFFVAIGSRNRPGFARLDPLTGLADEWTADVNGGILAGAFSAERYFLGGDLTGAASRVRRDLAVLSACVERTYFEDGDGDGQGDPTTGMTTCEPMAGFVDNGDDCDDSNPSVSAGSACDDGDPGTFDDLLDQACQCAGMPELDLVSSWMSTDGEVHALTLDEVNEVLYVGGAFTSVAYQTPLGARIDPVSGIPVGNAVHPNSGSISVVVPDGQGGWYIAGTFAFIAGVQRIGAAHINASGQLTQWNPNLNVIGSVRTMTLANNVVYLGGSFTSVGGQSRIGIAAVDAVTGAVLSWNANLNPNGIVNAIVVEGNAVHMGGEFFNVAGSQRSNFAKVDATNGSVLPFDPFFSSRINTMASRNGVLYVGGWFSMVNTSARNNVAALDLGPGTLNSWNPDLNGEVHVLVADEAGLFVAGDFTTANGQPRNRIASLSYSATVLDLDLGVNDQVDALAIMNGTMYVGGAFTTIGGVQRNHLAAIDLQTGTPLPWDPHPDNPVLAIAARSGRVYVGGTFSAFDVNDRSGLAAFHIPTGELLDWSPTISAGGQVRSLAYRQGKVYAGGNFTAANGVARNHVAAFDAQSGSLTPWNPNANDVVRSLAFNGPHILLGGEFNQIGGSISANVTEVDTSTGGRTNWTSTGLVLSGASYVSTIIASDRVLTGGNFESNDYPFNKNVALLDTASGQSITRTPFVNSFVLGLLDGTDRVYSVGDLTTADGEPRSFGAAFGKHNGQLLDWDPQANGRINAIDRIGSGVVVGGAFTGLGDSLRARLGAVDPISGGALSWSPDLNGPVNTIRSWTAGGYLFVGGNFNLVNGSAHSNLAVFADTDCAGVANGTSVAGQPCDDGDPMTIDDTWTDDCTCEGDISTGTGTVSQTAPVGTRPWPNPTDEVLYFTEPFTGVMYDINGRVVRNATNTSELQVGDLANGVYMLVHPLGQATRIVVQH